MITLEKQAKAAVDTDTVCIASSIGQLKTLGLGEKEMAHLQRQWERNGGAVARTVRGGHLLLVHIQEKGSAAQRAERARCAGSAMVAELNAANCSIAQVVALLKDKEMVLALCEGMALANHAFRKYKSGGNAPSFKQLRVVSSAVDKKSLEELADVAGIVCAMRDLVNEPVSFLNATQLSAEIRTIAKNTGLKVRVLDKAGIEAQGMGGLLAVNKGSIDPPTFTILEHVPKRPVNKEPILLVGKGVVYDTGGLSLKPTPNSMDHMKCDMAGSATMIGAIAAAALRGLPVHVVALIPATDNRPGGNAFAPGDVVRMHNGSTVEVMNSDAEGRMILADALSYGEKYKAELVFTAATLTGAAARAIGTQGIVAMGTAPERTFTKLSSIGDQVHERIARFPFWDEYDKELDSDIADMKNLGGDAAGMITAGKFLARFTTRPYIHLDIAGPAYLHKAEGYRGKGGTATGVRLLYHFLKQRAKK